MFYANLRRLLLISSKFTCFDANFWKHKVVVAHIYAFSMSGRNLFSWSLMPVDIKKLLSRGGRWLWFDCVLLSLDSSGYGARLYQHCLHLLVIISDDRSVSSEDNPPHHCHHVIHNRIIIILPHRPFLPPGDH